MRLSFDCFFDDAARTPWRTAWAYYWYGDADSKKFNETIAKWLIPTTHTASGVNSGYKWTGNGYEADLSKKRNFVSSSFSGGLGLATSSIGTEAGNTYLGTTYKTLTSLKSCEKAQGCGEGSVTGEKYYPATLNVLYLLLMTGNMPNLYDLTGFTPFTPDPTKAPSVSNAVTRKTLSWKPARRGNSRVKRSDARRFRTGRAPDGERNAERRY